MSVFFIARSRLLQEFANHNNSVMETACGETAIKALRIFKECTENVESFLQSQPEKVEKFKLLTKLLYDDALRYQKDCIAQSKALPKLIVKDFDDEQIWQQLELENSDALPYFKSSIAELQVKANLNNSFKDKKDDEKIDKSDLEKEEKNISSDDDDDEYIFDDDDTDSDSGICAEKQQQKDKSKKKKHVVESLKDSSVVDDQFFKLSKLDQFLRLEDLKEERRLQGESMSEDSDDIDYFGDIPSDDLISDKDAEEDMDDDNDENTDEKLEPKNSEIMGKIKSAREVMYKDFFDPPDSANEELISDENTEEFPSHIKESKNKEYDLRDYNSEEEDELPSSPKSKCKKNLLSSDDEEDISLKSVKTPFERQQEKERKKIQELEESILKPKPWQLTGEVDASKRPENSLVHQPTQFDCNVKQDLITTDELTEKIENIIKAVISNKAWNDVERKIKPIEEVFSYRKPVELEQTKSKKSLAEVYEEQYLKQMQKDKEEEENPKHTEIKKLMDKLIPELNALFSYIPKPPVPEIKVISNLPAITVEEVAPTAVSDAALLAPEEIKKKSVGDLKGQTEKTATDRKRERRKKKLHQKMRQKRQEEKLKKLAEKSPALAKKHSKLLELNKIKNNKNTVIADSKSSKKIKSSKDFFSELQDTVKSKVIKTKEKAKNKSKDITVAKLKL